MHRKRNNSKVPFATNDFGTSSEREVSRECFRGCSGGSVSSSDANEPESNKFSACFGAQVVALPAKEVEDIFLPAASTPATDAFSARLNPENKFHAAFQGLSQSKLLSGGLGHRMR
jgi:hypothetical protein